MFQLLTNFVLEFRLEIKANGSSTEAAMFCYQVSFTKLLSNASIGHGWIDLMLTVVQKASQAERSMNVFREHLKSALMDESCPFLSVVSNFDPDL